jgi:hypothetical protein
MRFFATLLYNGIGVIMKLKPWTIASVFAGAMFTLGFVGCDEEDDKQGSYTFTIDYASDFFQYGGWSIIQTADGRDALRAQEPEAGSVVVFNDLPAGRVTATTISIDTEQQNVIYLASFQGVRTGTWAYGGELNPPTIGQAAITVDFAPQDVDRTLWMEVSGGGSQSYLYEEIPAGTSQCQKILSVNRIESDGRIAILGRLFDPNTELPMLAGYLDEQGFAQGMTNYYHVTLDAAIDHPELSFSRPVMNVQVSGSREPLYHNFSLFRWNGNATSTLTLDLPDGFPLSGYIIYAAGINDDASFSATNRYSELPATVSIPSSSMDVYYNPDTQTIDDISISGDADLVAALWSAGYSGPNGWTNLTWSVWCDASVGIIFPPVLPDSIRAEIGLELSDLHLNWVFIVDCDGFDGISGFASQEFADDTPDYLEYNQYYTFTKYFELLTSTTIRAEEFQKMLPLGRRMHENNRKQIN